ncbi:antibiotic biosynthesis monooxygenase family protein [Albidovulum sediminicola]|uniref:Antibiotic biosynthesis monooxygenase n=1 Tax=Albidovulum sediminicola TaxID=2984331 RepID=A0ABT2Z2N3_9RHOB|nr:antibiotic biosynthesis monooxygenase [Defluviimonas sp. WL0075]MCV2865355.1 antibiotic biosynthesis monooxygenase [Defluviimonas sp. WL0075]
MIIRIFRVTVEDGKEAEFERFFLDTALPLVKSQPGIVSVTPGLPRPETPNEFCMVMVWSDVDAIKAFAGENWQQPHIHPDEAGLIRERSLHHYNLSQLLT